MPRLRTVSPNSPGWSRRRAGKGFLYLDEAGDRLDGEDVERIKALVIPPAWQQVWICPQANGHIQAVGVDDAGRRQYLYHPEWRFRQDQEKFERVTRLARRLPELREAVVADLSRDGMPFERAAATAVRLLDLGYFRIGNDAYVDEHGGFGLTTLEKRHVRRSRDGLVFCFEGKSGGSHRIVIDDDLTVTAVDQMRRRRGGAADRALAYKASNQWRPLVSSLVNEYLRDTVGMEVSAKDFRTWHATVLAAVALAESEEPGESRASRKRAVRAAVVEVGKYLGNTPAVAKSSYVDPRVIDLYEDGSTIRSAVRRRYDDDVARQTGWERAVLRMLSQAPRSLSRSIREPVL